MINTVTLLGRLGADPEVRRFDSGGAVCNLRVATSERWKDKNTGEQRERTEWHTVAIFNEGLCRVAESYAIKGAMVYITGSLRTRKWQDQNGADRYSTEVVVQGFGDTLRILKDGRPSEARTSNQQDAYSGLPGPGANLERGGSGARSFELDDDIPF